MTLGVLASRVRGWRLILMAALVVAASAARADTAALLTWDQLWQGAAAPVSAADQARQARLLDAVNGGAPLPEDFAPVAHRLLDQAHTIDGYVLPLVQEGRRVTEFLLVPWVGACIHTPAPPSNQMIHVSYPEGLRLDTPYAAVRLSGILRHSPDYHMLFLVDGSRPVPASYTLEGAAVAGTPSTISAQSSATLPMVHRAQLWANDLFTGAMQAISTGAPGALVFALGLAFAYGALHTVGPGHGKSVVVSYFVGSGGSMGRGVRMGIQIAVMHVLSAVMLVWLFDTAVRHLTGAPPSDIRAIRLGSYGLIIVIGAVMLWHAAQAVRAARKAAHYHHHHHAGCAACSHAARPRGGGWLAAAVGVVPCTGALLVMLFGLANDLVWPAIAMVVAISAGMALAMSALGVAALWGRSLASNRLGPARAQRFDLGAQVVGATCVLVIGLVLFTLTLAWPVVDTQALAFSTITEATQAGG